MPTLLWDLALPPILYGARETGCKSLLDSAEVRFHQTGCTPRRTAAPDGGTQQLVRAASSISRRRYGTEQLPSRLGDKRRWERPGIELGSDRGAEAERPDDHQVAIRIEVQLKDRNRPVTSDLMRGLRSEEPATH